MIVVAFYTKNTTHEGLAMRLQDRLNELNYESYIVGYNSRGAWKKSLISIVYIEKLYDEGN